jgi:hypothetical protein
MGRCCCRPMLTYGFLYNALDQGYLSVDPKRPPPHIGFTSLLVNSLVWLLYSTGVNSPLPAVLPNIAGVVVGAIASWKINSFAPLSAGTWVVMMLLSACTLLLHYGAELTGVPFEEGCYYNGILGNIVTIALVCSPMATWPSIISAGDVTDLCVCLCVGLVL